ncbi:putative transmembrane protein [Azorhizobium caulinodans ORS 571]|uniref:Putative transmembrane protein n=1 Tax=Azorhizobium caulinodans (strain ATCC 43989 / DSM 5975 / JCM 20966 / LMG 6465 / NBRC 14845 / NCIMB 13405 / ORS 571) TaxID=438753 RepID=A8HUX7_AZOC5|nr:MULTISPECIES: DUF5993 family protein [Azorhizobium]TDT92809.1 hypothetical protein DFO45_3570 [Azorhizobium sp. AG788]BAF86988.1 putative transmembrane protein [Azorhizobium caulinodans ORS 571]
MMSIPFFGIALAFLCILIGQRLAAIALWGLSLIALLALFRMHATDPLNLVL